MNDLGEANVILGINFTRSGKGISLDQSHYVENFLKKYDYFDGKEKNTLYDASVKLFKNTGESVRQTEYASIIDSLRYATYCTRLFGFSLVSLVSIEDLFKTMPQLHSFSRRSFNTKINPA
jgi:hypothetical protein